MVAPFKETPMNVAMTLALAKPRRAGNETNGGIHWGSRIGLTLGPRNPQLRDVVLLSPWFTGFQHVSTIRLVMQDFAGPSTDYVFYFHIFEPLDSHG